MAKKKSSNTVSRQATAGSFKKGDPRINRNGQISKKRLAFNKSLRELLVAEGDVIQGIEVKGQVIKAKKLEWLIKAVWNKAINGEAWAVQFIADRVEGKISQPVGADETLQAILDRIITDKRPEE